MGCKTCSTTTPTTCSLCTDGFYLTSTICTACAFPCKTCLGTTINSCTACLGNYVLANPVPDQCICPTSPLLWPSNVTQNCETCSTIVPNCNTCITMGTPSYTGCSSCADPYYAEADGTCVLCPVTCTSCTSPTTCSGCANNLVLSSTTTGTCIPNTSSDPNLAYYGPTNSPVSCLDLLSNCLSCIPSPLTCMSCGPGTFKNGSICQNCDPTCATCDSMGCTTTCPSGLTLNGNVCECTGNCPIC